MASIPEDFPRISGIRQSGVEVPVPEPHVVKELLHRNREERALLRTLLGLSERAAQARNLFGSGDSPLGRSGQ